MAKPITWLHLSDLHYCPSRSGYDDRRILQALVSDLRGLNQTFGLRPDLLFFTGDLAYGDLGSAATPFEEQLAGGHKFIDNVRSAFTPIIRRSNVFLVPGNHDVLRGEVTPDQTEWLEHSKRTSQEIQSLIQRADRQWERYLQRLGPYREALRTTGFQHLLRDSKRLVYSTMRKFYGLRVGVAGLNSAWSSSRDQEKGRLWLGGDWQIKQLRNDLGAVDVSFALVHHPFNWMDERENEIALWHLAEREFTFLLHGHEHAEWVSVHGHRHARLAAAACYDREGGNGYSVSTFDPRTKQLRVWLRKYDRQGGGWIPNVISGKTDTDGCWSEVLVPPQTGASRSRAAVQPVQNNKKLPLKVPRRGYDAFFAIPMATVSPEEYKAHRAEALAVLKGIREHCRLPRVFYPGEHIESADDFDPPDRAVRQGLVAIAKTRLFVMMYSHEAPSSILVEAGFALALRIPSLYFVRKGLKLPFLLTAAQQAFPDVKMYEYRDLSVLLRHLRIYGADICAELLEKRWDPSRAEAFVDSMWE